MEHNVVCLGVSWSGYPFVDDTRCASSHVRRPFLVNAKGRRAQGSRAGYALA